MEQSKFVGINKLWWVGRLKKYARIAFVGLLTSSLVFITHRKHRNVYSTCILLHPSKNPHWLYLFIYLYHLYKWNFFHNHFCTVHLCSIQKCMFRNLEITEPKHTYTVKDLGESVKKKTKKIPRKLSKASWRVKHKLQIVCEIHISIFIVSFSLSYW